MSTTIRTRCPHCQAALKVPSGLDGKNVVCPKCQTKFQASLASHELNAPPSQVSQPADDPWSEFESVPTHMPVQSGNPYGQPRGGVGKTKSPQKKSASAKRSSNKELSEADSNIQSSGIFLVVVPCLAAILPMFGLQLKRLAALGEYAPLGALFLGMIGSGMIFYARRSRSDAPAFAGGAFLFCLICGVGGFLVLRNAVNAEYANAESSGQQNAASSPESPAPGSVSLHKSAEPHPFHNPRTSRESNVPTGSRPSTTANPFEDTSPFEDTRETDSSRATDDPRDSLSEVRERHQRQVDEMRRQQQQFMEGMRQPSEEMQNQLAAGSESGSDRRPSSSHSRLRDDSLQSITSVPGLLKKYGESEIQFSSEFRRNQSSGQKYSFVNLVGKQTSMGQFHHDRPVTGVSVYRSIRRLVLMPIQEGSSLDNTIQSEDGQALAGFRFAFSDDEIVGIQGLLASSDGGKLVETQWIGKETDDIRESMNPKPEQARMVCFSERGATRGFAWVVEEK